VLVLAILADVFGTLGALLGFVFGATLAGVSQGFAGEGAARGGVLALFAATVGIVATTLVNGRPRIGGVGLLAAGILGTVGTLGFALGGVLYAIAGGCAILRTNAAAPEVGSADRRAPLARARIRWRPTVSRRLLAIGAGLALLGGSALAVATLLEPAEQRPVRALLAAIAQGSDLALADQLAPALRTGSASGDASLVLTAALNQSDLGFITNDWLRTLGPVTGTRLSFDNVSVATTTKNATTARVHVRGQFAPANDNTLLNAMVQGLRRAFDADVPVVNVEGRWFIAATPAATATVRATGSVAPATQAPLAVLLTPTASPIRHLAFGTYDAPSTAVVASQGWTLRLLSTTIDLDESTLLRFELTIGPSDGPWAARESRLELANGQWLGVRTGASTFYEGGKGAGAVISVALAFPPGLAGQQPFVIRVCGNLGFCWPPLQGPHLGER
jgi:hypothetical protein